jgi:hypothetical protein
VKTITQLKLVSKSWNTLITSPSFIALNASKHMCSIPTFIALIAVYVLYSSKLPILIQALRCLLSSSYALNTIKTDMKCKYTAINANREANKHSNKYPKFLLKNRRGIKYLLTL